MMAGIAKKTVDEVSKINAVQVAGVIIIMIALNFLGGLMGLDVYGMIQVDPGMGLFVFAIQLLVAVAVARLFVIWARGKVL